MKDGKAVILRKITIRNSMTVLYPFALSLYRTLLNVLEHLLKEGYASYVAEVSKISKRWQGNQIKSVQIKFTVNSNEVLNRGAQLGVLETFDAKLASSL